MLGGRASAVFPVEGGSSWVSISHLSPRTVSSSAPIAPTRAEPAKGGVVVIQEIFGVNHHIRAVCDRLAAEGYAAVAPALFDRQQPNFECGYSPDEIANARKFVANPDWGAMMKDVQAAIDDAKKSGPAAIIGFCLGGSSGVPCRRQAQRPFGRDRLLRRPDRQECRRETESADATAFRREGCLDSDERRRHDQAEARRRL